MAVPTHPQQLSVPIQTDPTLEPMQWRSRPPKFICVYWSELRATVVAFRAQARRLFAAGAARDGQLRGQGGDTASIVLALPQAGKDIATGGRQLDQTSHLVHCFLPVRDVGLRFLVHAPFELTSSQKKALFAHVEG